MASDLRHYFDETRRPDRALLRDGRSNEVRFCVSCGGRVLEGDDGRRCSACGRIAFANPLPGVTVLLGNGNGSLLLGQRRRPPNRYCLPGGFIEFGESFLEAAHREVAEETGLEMHVEGIVNVVSNRIRNELETLVVVLLATVSGGVLRPGDDIIDVMWVEAPPLPEMEFAADEYIAMRFFEGSLDLLPPE